MIRARPECRASSAVEPAGESAIAFEPRCAAVGCVPEASVARMDAGFGSEDERAAREEEGFVTDES
jgi:hypothetical protein